MSDSEQLQRALYRIADAAISSETLDDLYLSIHRTVSDLLPAENFFIALFDPEHNLLSFPYFVDQYDEAFPTAPPGKGLTEYVLRSGRPLLASREIFRELVLHGEADLCGTDSVDWLGVPLKIEERTIGVMVVQSYTEGIRYSQREMDIMTFVSTQIAMAVERKRAEQALKESEIRLRQIIDLVPHFIFAKDVDGRFIIVNKAVAEVYGTTVEELTRKTDADFARSEEEAINFRRDDLEVINSGMFKVVPEERITDSNGAVRFLHTIKIPFTVSGSTTKGVLGVSTDITERKHTEEELRTSKEHAERSERLKDAFIANISHEIRTPLNIVMGYSNLLLEEYAVGAPPQIKMFLERIQQGGQRLMRTVDMILNISRMQVGDFRFQPARHDLIPLLNRITEEFRLKAQEKNLALTCHCDFRSAFLHFDEYYISQVFANLIENAIKYSNGGSISLLLTADEDGMARVDVTDTGVGIAEEFLPYVFEPYSQEEIGYSRSYEGLGLGLALVRKYLSLHNAAITVSSVKGSGSTFSVHFNQPFYEEPAAETDSAAHEATSSENSAGKAASPDRKTVLVVEDDAPTLQYMRTILEPRYNAITADTADKAWSALENIAIDLVLMDISLKDGIDGLALTRAIKQSDAFRSIPVIAVTAHAFPHDRKQSLDAGCDEYLAKPFGTNQLTELIDRFLS
jgi:PAS domain S-box-containing protein